MGVKLGVNRYEHHPESALEGVDGTIFWEVSISTVRKIQVNPPALIIKFIKENVCTLIRTIPPRYETE